MTRQRDFIVDQRKLTDAVTAMHDFLWSVMNDDGSPVRMPLYVTPDYVREMIASVATNLRHQGDKLKAVEEEQQRLLNDANGDKSVFRHTVERVQ